MAVLADFHNTDPSPILKSLEKQKPEILIIPGDFVYGDKPAGDGRNLTGDSNVCAFLRGCASIAPTFVSLGNHEWTVSPMDHELIISTGITLLDNCWTTYKNVVIGGLSSAYYSEYQTLREKNPDKGLYPVPIYALRSRKITPRLEFLDDLEKQPGYKILLCHHPEYYPKYLRNRNIDLILAGHAHGGQWRYHSLISNEMRGVYAPGQGLFPSLTSGIIDGRLVISRGLSNPTFIPRINNPPEIIYLGY